MPTHYKGYAKNKTLCKQRVYNIIKLNFKNNTGEKLPEIENYTQCKYSIFQVSDEVSFCQFEEFLLHESYYYLLPTAP